MFGSLAHRMYRRRWYVVGIWIVVLAVAMALASQVDSVLGPGNFVEKGSDSARAASLLDARFHQDPLKVSLIEVENARVSVSDPGFRATLASLARRVRADAGLRVTYLENPLVTGDSQLIARDRHAAAILISSNLKEEDLEGQIDHLRQVARTPGYIVHVTGTAAANHDYAVDTKNDLSRSESITVPILVLILMVVFGTLIACALPLVLAGCSIVLSLGLVYIFGHYLDTSVYVTNVVTALGLGVGIDYSLFIVYRFREELARTGNNVEEALVRTMATTGRAVFFSGLTVAIGLSSLILTQVSFMESMGLGGMVVPVTALLAAMTLLPALLGIIGAHVNTPVLRRALSAVTRHAAWVERLPHRMLLPAPGGVWHRWAMTVMRRPWITGGIALAIMLALAFPVTRLNTAFGGLANAPKNLDSIQGQIAMIQRFPSQPNPTQVVIERAGPVGTLLQPAEVAGLRRLEGQIRADLGTLRVTGIADFVTPAGTVPAAQRQSLYGHYLTPDGKTGLITVVGRDDVGTKAAENLVRRIRTITASDGHGVLRHDTVYVGGTQASYTDFNDALYAHFPLIVASVLALTYVFLFWAFRSLVLPLKAVLLNLLSIGAAYGMLQIVFQGGVGDSILRFTPESGVAGWVPVFLFAFLFGLSMDYEVFLLSRIREGWLATGSNRVAVATGLEQTGRLISSAAAIMVVAFAGFMIGSQLQLKELGLGLVASIVIDATIIRLVLVPSIMRLLGGVNWWVPSFLREFAARGVTFGEGGSVSAEPEAAALR